MQATFDAQLSFLPDITWNGAFTVPVQNSSVGTFGINVTPPNAQSLLKSLGSQFFSLGDGIPVLGPLSTFINQPLPLIDESIGQLTGLDKDLPSLPSLPSDFANFNGSYDLAGGTLTVNVTQATLTDFIHGIPIPGDGSLISWTDTGEFDLLDLDITIPVYGIGVPGIISAEIDATFGLHASLTYNIGFGLDSNGFWITAGTPDNPNLGLEFDVTAGLQGQVEVFGFPLAEAGGDIGFGVEPYISLTAAPSYVDPNTVPDKVYLKDLAVFGSNPFTDIADDLSVGISGEFTGEIYASINLWLFSLTWSWGVEIPVFNFERSPTWPTPPNSGPGETPWTNLTDNSGVLTFDATNAGDNITLSQVPDPNVPGTNDVIVTWPGHPANTPLSEQFQANSFVFNGGSGNDTVTADSGFDTPVHAIAGSGDEDFNLDNNRANNTLVGGSGSDTLIGGSGTDELIGGTGNDTITANGQNADTILGGSGNEVVTLNAGDDSFEGSSGNYLINGESGTYMIDAGSGSDTIYAGDGSKDTIYGGSGGNNYLQGSNLGYDVIYGVGPNTTIVGGNGGNDTLYGGSGNSPGAVTDNLITGAGGNNSIFGGSGGDTLAGGTGNNTLYAGSGNETLCGGYGQDLYLNPNQPGLLDAAGETPYSPSSGNNLLIGGSGNDVLYGDTTGHNTLQAGTGNDTLYAGTGGDYLVAGSGNDALIGGPGNDTLELPFVPTGTPQPLDTLVGGAGVNTLVIEAALSQGSPGLGALADSVTASATTITLSAADISSLPTNAGNFPIEIDNEEMLVTGVSGDTLTVQRGYNGTTPTAHALDTPVLTPPTPSTVDYKLYFSQPAGTSNQYQATLSNLDTGAAVGQIQLTLPDDIANVDLDGGAGNNWIQVDPDVDLNMYLYGGPGNNTLMAGSGNDTLVAGPGTSVLYGGTGNDILYGGDSPSLQQTPQVGADGTETSRSGVIEGNDTLIAGSGNTELYAGNGNDVLIGGSVARQVGANGVPGLASLQNDDYVLVDGSGRDVLDAGSGNDLLIAGIDSPGAALTAGSGTDTLVGGPGQDILLGGTGNVLMLGGNALNVMDAGQASNATLVGGSGLEYEIGGSGNNVLYAQTDPTSWVKAITSAASFNVLLQQPVVEQGQAGTELNNLSFQQSALGQQLAPLTTIVDNPTLSSNANFDIALTQGSNVVTGVPSLQIAGSGIGTELLGSNEITNMSTLPSDLFVGEVVAGAGIPAGTTIAAIDPITAENPENSILLSAKATANNNSITLYFPELPFAVGENITVGSGVQAIPAGTTIVSILSPANGQNSFGLVLSNNATANATEVSLNFALTAEQNVERITLGNQLANVNQIDNNISVNTGQENLYVNYLQGGNGTNQFYAATASTSVSTTAPAWIVGGKNAQNTYYNYNYESDTILGANGNDTLMLQADGIVTLASDYYHAAGAVDVAQVTMCATVSDTTLISGLVTSGLFVGEQVFGQYIPAGDYISSKSGNAIDLESNANGPATGATSTIGFGWIVGNTGSNLSGLTNIGVQTLAGNDSVTFSSSLPNNLPFGISVVCGSGNDVVDASAYEGPVTLLAGTGNDTLRIGTSIATGSEILGNAAGDTELDVVDSASNAVTVSNGQLEINTLPINYVVGNTLPGSKTVTGVDDALGLLAVGQTLVDSGNLPTGTTITALSATSITLSNAATLNQTGAILTLGLNIQKLVVIGGFRVLTASHRMVRSPPSNWLEEQTPQTTTT